MSIYLYCGKIKIYESIAFELKFAGNGALRFRY